MSTPTLQTTATVPQSPVRARSWLGGCDPVAMSDNHTGTAAANSFDTVVFERIGAAKRACGPGGTS